MSLDLKVIMPSEIQEIIDFEERKLRETVVDENDRMFQAWNARWRKESLEHYLPMGWSFLARDEGELEGYFLAQPLLFLDGQTQSLWVEHLQYSSLEARDQLCDLAYRLAREKHLQRVYFPNTTAVLNSVKAFKPEAWNAMTLVIKTTKG